jgi:hypothetical protein
VVGEKPHGWSDNSSYDDEDKTLYEPVSVDYASKSAGALIGKWKSMRLHLVAK